MPIVCKNSILNSHICRKAYCSINVIFRCFRNANIAALIMYFKGTHYPGIYFENYNIPRHIFVLVVSGYFILVYYSYLTVDLSALWIWINHPHAIKTNFANVSVVVE